MYTIPNTLKREIEAFSREITDFQSGTIEPVKFKAIRVPMGIYEQRNNGTYMVRARCAAGVISPAQLLGVARIAAKHGCEPIHFTTRQELQFHNVSLEQTPAILAELYDLGLSSRGGGGNTVRNIMASEDAGIATGEEFDVTPYAVALTNTLIAEPDSWSLPRKYKIAFAGNESDNANALFNDLGFLATTLNGEKGFKVFLGGGLGSKPSAGNLLFDFLPASDILYVAEAVKQLFSEHGNRRNRHKARIRYIFYKLGVEKVFELFHGYFNQLKQERKYPLNLPEMPASTSQPNRLAHDGSRAFTLWAQRYVNEQRQQGLYSVEIPFEHGMAGAKTLERLSQILIPFGPGCLRLTMRQNILLRNIPGDQLQSLFHLLNTIGIEISSPRILNSLVACTGADTCRLGICLSKGASKAIKSRLSTLDKLTLDKVSNFRINLSGCPNSCGQHQVANLGFYGRASRNERLYPAYYVTLGGQTGWGIARLGEMIGQISARDLPVFAAEVIELYASRKEAYDGFDSYLQAGGEKEIGQLLKKYDEVPSFEEDKNYYFDWGAQELFSLTGKGQAECSAGMFDMIDFDRDFILELQKKIKESFHETATSQLLYEVVFHASRMLLVTRGIEPKNREEVFTAFKDDFIREGHVDMKFGPVVQLALKNPEGNFQEYQGLIFELASSVIELYNSMDDSLQFKVKQVKPKSESPENEAQEKRFKDFRGVACPMNFVKTKIELAQMHSGEFLEILLDDGAPINNVPGSVRGEGHDVSEVKNVENYWSVLIRKK
ncbi:sulfurtransferase TusA family protein [Sunxiuqinia dokdonensis]|uniref:Uncharacterized protein n=2 Tax=Sunxiuqinia TaxID=1254401 RepID=A0A0L8V8M3_9BACT|nr:sulfurtransferase TusA family protein [Sunxiuqinia dokdonensis]KOH44794.1 hypothetical protein NC99_23410 [Sunxiuqinia dokdonensis]